MADQRTDHLEREAHVWGDFERLVRMVPLDRWAASDVLEGWSVKEMLWHVAGWLDECAQHLEKMRDGTFIDYDETDEETDVRNAAFAAEAKTMDSGAVWDGLLAVRATVRARWEELPEITDTAIEWFAGESYRHYKDHIADLERAAKP